MKKLVFSLALIGLGTFAMAQQKEPLAPEKMEKREKGEKNFDKMKTELGLSDRQVEQLKNLGEKHRAEMEKERNQQQELRKAKKEQRDAELKKILTPEQFQKWENLHKEKGEGKRDFRKKRK